MNERIVNLTQHRPVSGQEKVFDYEPDEVARLMTFDDPPSPAVLAERASALAALAKQAGAPGAMIGGPPWFMAPLENALREKGIRPVYAFTRRESTEEVSEDGGELRKVSVFRHVGFVEPPPPGSEKKPPPQTEPADSARILAMAGQRPAGLPRLFAQIFRTGWNSLAVVLFCLGVAGLFLIFARELWSTFEPVFAISTLIAAVVIWFNEKRENAFRRLPKVLTVFFVLKEEEEGRKTDRVVFFVNRAPLAGEADIRSWSQQLGLQLNHNQRLALDAFEIRNPDRPSRSVAGGSLEMEYRCLIRLSELPSVFDSRPEARALVRDYGPEQVRTWHVGEPLRFDPAPWAVVAAT